MKHTIRALLLGVLVTPLLFINSVAGASPSTEDENQDQDCETPIEVEAPANLDVSEVVIIDLPRHLPCHPHPGDLCVLRGGRLIGVIDGNGRCVCRPHPTTTTTSTPPPTTPPPPSSVPPPPPPAPPAPPQQVVVPVPVPGPTQTVVLERPAPAATPVVGRPSFTG